MGREGLLCHTTHEVLAGLLSLSHQLGPGSTAYTIYWWPVCRFMADEKEPNPSNAWLFSRDQLWVVASHSQMKSESRSSRLLRTAIVRAPNPGFVVRLTLLFLATEA